MSNVYWKWHKIDVKINIMGAKGIIKPSNRVMSFLFVSHVSNYSRDQGMQIENIIGISIISVNTEISPDIYTVVCMFNVKYNRHLIFRSLGSLKQKFCQAWEHWWSTVHGGRLNTLRLNDANINPNISQHDKSSGYMSMPNCRPFLQSNLSAIPRPKHKTFRERQHPRPAEIRKCDH